MMKTETSILFLQMETWIKANSEKKGVDLARLSELVGLHFQIRDDLLNLVSAKVNLIRNELRSFRFLLISIQLVRRRERVCGGYYGRYPANHFVIITILMCNYKIILM